MTKIKDGGRKGGRDGLTDRQDWPAGLVKMEVVETGKTDDMST